MDTQSHRIWQFFRKGELESMTSKCRRWYIFRFANRMWGEDFKADLGKRMCGDSLVQFLDGHGKLVLMTNFGVLVVSLLELFIIYI